MRHVSDSSRPAFAAKAEPGTAEYKARVAEPTMGAVDSLPPAYRQLVHEFGYIDVYRAWRKGMAPTSIRSAALANGGVFDVDKAGR